MALHLPVAAPPQRRHVTAAVVSANQGPLTALPLRCLAFGRVQELRWSRSMRLWPGNRSVSQTAAAGGAPDESDEPPMLAAGPQSTGTDKAAASSSSSSAAAGTTAAQPTAAAAAATPSPATATDAAVALEGEGLGAAAALAAFFGVLSDTLRVLVRLLLVEPLGWVLNRCGLLAIRAADVVAQLERANRISPLEPDRLAASLRVLNKHHPASVVEVRRVGGMQTGEGVDRKGSRQRPAPAPCCRRCGRPPAGGRRCPRPPRPTPVAPRRHPCLPPSLWRSTVWPGAAAAAATPPALQ